MERGFSHGNWYECKMSLFYGDKFIGTDENEDKAISKTELPVLKDTAYHTIKGEADFVLIELK